MYEEHFGLSRNPFQSVAEGEAVYEGPEQKKVIAALKNALGPKDSIAVICGPVGVGKTTIVQRAIEEVAPDRLVARLGRTAVGSDELVDLLLAQFGVVREPTRRFECLKTFNRILNEHAASGSRVFIVIEDAERLGEELLEELEALTAADGGACAGANIIMMGPQKLDKLIVRPSLERLRQRIRLQKTLERFNAEEVEAYLRHRLEAAGGDYDKTFEAGTALMVRRCSGGIPRVINGLCETALNETACNELSQVTGRIVFRVAVDVFGMAPGDTPGHTQTAPPAPQPAAPAIKPQPDRAPEPALPEKAPAPVAVEPAAAEAARAIPKKVTAPLAKPAAPNEKADPTVPVAKVATEPAREPKKPMPPRAPKPPAGANGADGAATTITAPAARPSRAPASKPLPELPPKFKFADEIVVDKNTRPKMPAEPKQVDPPEPPVLKPEPEKAADRKPAVKDTPVPPSAAAEDIPTLGDSARVEAVTARPAKPAAPVAKSAAPAAKPDAPPVKPAAPAARPDAPAARPDAPAAKPDAPAAKPDAPAAKPDAPAAKPAAPAAKPAAPVAKPASAARPESPPAKAPAPKAEPVEDAAALSLEEPEPAASRSEPQADEGTASFAKVDHDMLDAALASLAVHDEEDGPPEEALALHAPPPEPAPPAVVPEVTLDKNIEAVRPKPDPAELDRMAAELEQMKSLEEMSDKLAETLFGSQELEAISMQIREEAAPEENPVALETSEAAGVAAAPETARPEAPPTPAVAEPQPEPQAAPPKPAAKVKPPAAPSGATPEQPAKKGPQLEPIESQFNTSMTATLKTLNKHDLPPVDDDDDSGERPGGLLGRLKNTFKS